MNVRILGAGIPAAIVLGWLGLSQARGDFDSAARALALAILVVLGASRRNWARLMAAAWIGVLGTVAALGSGFASGVGAFSRVLGFLVAVLLIAAAITIARERPGSTQVA